LGVDLEKKIPAKCGIRSRRPARKWATGRVRGRKGTVWRGTRVLGDLVVDGNELITHGTAWPANNLSFVPFLNEFLPLLNLADES
jgi:hypothetical protein